ncbi:MAG: hypothetical protein MZW92_22260 [Comamonadaceae bacterium]|nr:hypothetical protein [Comamonadaceae bacterium]
MQPTLKDLLAHRRRRRAGDLRPRRAALSFGALRTLIREAIARLNELGIGRNDRVAIVLANGPEMARLLHRPAPAA